MVFWLKISAAFFKLGHRKIFTKNHTKKGDIENSLGLSHHHLTKQKRKLKIKEIRQNGV